MLNMNYFQIFTFMNYNAGKIITNNSEIKVNKPRALR